MPDELYFEDLVYDAFELRFSRIVDLYRYLPEFVFPVKYENKRSFAPDDWFVKCTKLVLY